MNTITSMYSEIENGNIFFYVIVGTLTAFLFTGLFVIVLCVYRKKRMSVEKEEGVDVRLPQSPRSSSRKQNRRSRSYKRASGDFSIYRSTDANYNALVRSSYHKRNQKLEEEYNQAHELAFQKALQERNQYVTPPSALRHHLRKKNSEQRKSHSYEKILILPTETDTYESANQALQF